MKITHYCNSFITIESKQTVLFCDPWVGISNYGGWLSYPLTSLKDDPIDFNKCTDLYISHLHEDHFCPKLLKKYFDKNTPVYIKKFPDQRLYKKLIKIGFININELEGWSTRKLSESLEITIVPTDVSNTQALHDEIQYEIDTSLLIRSIKNNTFFYNNVDSPISLQGLAKVKDCVMKFGPNSNIDVACIAVGAASEYPQCFLNIDRESEANRVIDNSLKSFFNKLKVLKPKSYFPAGGSYLIPGKYSPLNEFIAQPGIAELKLVLLKCIWKPKFFDIEGGGTIEVDKKEILQTTDKLKEIYLSKLDAINVNNNLQYEYLNKEYANENNGSIEDLFSIAKKKYFLIMNKLSIKVKWRVVFHLYENLEINDFGLINNDLEPCHTFILDKDKLYNPNYSLICHLDKQLFIGLLQRRFIWNLALSGSIILFEREPDIFIPTIPFSLNYLAA